MWEATWFGPGRLAAIVADGPGEETWYEAPLATIDLDSGKETILYRSDGRQLGVPAASPSGQRLAVLEAICSDRLVIAGDVLLIDPDSPNGEPTRLDTGGVDVTHLAWRDDHRLGFIGVRIQDTVAGEIDADTGQATEQWSSPENTGGVYPEGSMQQLDFQEFYLHSTLAFIGISDVHTVRVEGMAIGDEAIAKAIASAKAEADGVVQEIESAASLELASEAA